MRVEFHRTGERRYAVVVRRDGLPPLQMNPAPGFDALMPHDLLHFVVEKELGLRRGIFGQIADGGTAGTFHLAEQSGAKSDGRANSRRRREVRQRGKKLLEKGHDDCARSERATYVCWHDWLSKSAKPDVRGRALEMKDNAQSVLGSMPEAERKAFDDKFLARVRAQLDKLSGEWSALEIGEFLTVEWSPQK